MHARGPAENVMSPFQVEGMLPEGRGSELVFFTATGV